jgi:aminoglycoside 6'-N-acetyltransferase
VGYIQYWFIGHHQNAAWIADHPWLAALPADAIGVDLSIGDPSQLSQGLGSGALRTFAQCLVRQGYRTIIIDPDTANARAVRAYEKAGFRAIPQLLGQTGDALIMRYALKGIEPEQ